MREDRMDKVEVFHFRVYDPTKDEIVIPPFKSTRKRIESDLIKGEILSGTGEIVLVSDLDAQERYDPNKR
jgi:hypothetical protein